MTKIRWRGRSSIDGRFHVNADNVRGEGVCYFLEMSRSDQQAATRFGIETAFYGRGGVSKVKAAAQQIANVIMCARCGRLTLDPDKWDPEVDTGRILCNPCWDIEHP